MSVTSTIIDIEGWIFWGEFLSTFYSDNNVNSDNKNNNNDNKTDNNDMLTKTLTPVHCRMKSGSAVVPFLLRFLRDIARCKLKLFCSTTICRTSSNMATKCYNVKKRDILRCSHFCCCVFCATAICHIFLRHRNLSLFLVPPQFVTLPPTCATM